MPRSPARPCTYHNCGALVQDGSRCEKHRLQERRLYDRMRGTAAERGYDLRWRKARERYLAEHPLCVECARQGRRGLATVVDHIIPHRKDMALFWDEQNWQALCKWCHDRKTAELDGRWGAGVA